MFRDRLISRPTVAARPPRPAHDRRSRGAGAAAALLTGFVAAGAVGTAVAASVKPAVDALTLVTFAANPFDPADPVVLNTNACVAAIAKADLVRAHIACREAVDAAHTARRNTLAAAFSGAANRHDLAITYSNRAVMYLLAGEFDAAKRDIARAAILMPQDAGIAATRARLEAGVTRPSRVARVAL